MSGLNRALALIVAGLIMFPTCSFAVGASGQSAGEETASNPSSIIIATDAPAVSAATSAPEPTQQPEPYEVTTFLVNATFPAKPHIDVYNYMLGDSVCKLALYHLEYGESEMYLLSLTFPDELSAALDGMDFDARTSMLRMALDVMETLGFVVASEDVASLFDMPCYMFAAYDDSRQFAGWATMDSRQAIFAFALDDDAGYGFLGDIYTRREAEFDVNGRNASFQNAMLNFPYSISVEDGVLISQNDLTHEWAEIIQLPDMAVLMQDESSDTLGDMLCEMLPEGATDISTQMLDSALTMLYSYDSSELGMPMQGRLILIDGYVLRMEASFDDAGDAFMDEFYLE